MVAYTHKTYYMPVNIYIYKKTKSIERDFSSDVCVMTVLSKLWNISDLQSMHTRSHWFHHMVRGQSPEARCQRNQSDHGELQRFKYIPSSQRCSTCRWVSRFAATIHVTKSVTHNWLHRFTVLVYFGKYMFMANTIIMMSDDWKGLLWLLTTKFKSAYDHFLQAEEEIPLRCCLALTYCIDNNRMNGRMDKESRNILYNIIT